MIRQLRDDLRVVRPDYIPEGQEHLYPASGGIFHDFVPDGETALEMHGYTADATVSAEKREEATKLRSKRISRQAEKSEE